MSEYELKICPGYFAAVIDGSKPFEVRKDDRLYVVGDVLHLWEWDPRGVGYTGRSVRVSVTCTVRNPMFVKPGYVILGIRVMGADRVAIGDHLYRPGCVDCWAEAMGDE